MPAISPGNSARKAKNGNARSQQRDVDLHRLAPRPPQDLPYHDDPVAVAQVVRETARD